VFAEVNEYEMREEKDNRSLNQRFAADQNRMRDSQSFFESDPNFADLIRRYQPVKTPSKLYHYTDHSGLLGIIQSKTLWATHFEYTNDATEVIHGIGVALKQLELAVSQTDSSDVEYKVEDYLLDKVPNSKPSDALVQVALATLRVPQIERKSSYEFFFACLSEHGDQLSQWRAYARDATGFAVGLSGDVLRNQFVLGQLRDENSGDTVDVLKVIYDSKAQAEIVATWISCMCKRFDDMIPGLPVECHRDAFLKANTWLIASLIGLALHFKHPGFVEEDEWRIIFCKYDCDRSESRKCIPIQTRSNPSGVIPYVALPLCPPQEGLALEHLIVGPKRSARPGSTPSAFGIDTLCSSLVGGAPKLGIGRSEIPYC